MTTDPRRFIPKMDEILQYPAVRYAQERVAPHKVRAIIDAVLDDVRSGTPVSYTHLTLPTKA